MYMPSATGEFTTPGYNSSIECNINYYTIEKCCLLILDFCSVCNNAIRRNNS